MNSRCKDVTGERFGRLLALEYCGIGSHKQAMFLCLCDCGKYVVIRGTFLTRGITKSCGCLQKDHAKKHMKQINDSGKRATQTRLTHGKRYHHFYSVWSKMKGRCYCENNTQYKYYGGKGVAMCDQWKNDFMSFYEWAESSGWSKGLTIDRIDNNGNYCPENCRWATIKEQIRNRSNTVYLEHNGEKKRLIEWCEEKNIRYKLAHARMKKGYSFEEIFKPVFWIDTHKEK